MPNFLTPVGHYVSIHLAVVVAVDKCTIWKIFFWRRFVFKDDYWLDLLP